MPISMLAYGSSFNSILEVLRGLRGWHPSGPLPAGIYQANRNRKTGQRCSRTKHSFHRHINTWFNRAARTKGGKNENPYFWFHISENTKTLCKFLSVQKMIRPHSKQERRARFRKGKKKNSRRLIKLKLSEKRGFGIEKYLTTRYKHSFVSCHPGFVPAGTLKLPRETQRWWVQTHQKYSARIFT